MKFNLGDLMKLLGSSTGGKSNSDVQSILLKLISNENPKLAKDLFSAMESGKDPSVCLRDYVNNGILKTKDIDRAEQAYKTLSSFGVLKNVPDNIWDNLRNFEKSDDKNDKFLGF